MGLGVAQHVGPLVLSWKIWSDKTCGSGGLKISPREHLPPKNFGLGVE
jgi:hypothetical protein